MTPRLSFDPMGWVLWAAACFVLLQTVPSAWVAPAIVAAVLTLWWTTAPERTGLAAPVGVCAGLIVLAWVVVTFAVGAGAGDVLWVLPEWADPSGVPIGGPLTTGALIAGAEQGLRALAHVALLACLLKSLDGSSAARLMDASLGRAAKPLHPVCFVGDVLVADERARRSELAHGLTPLTWTQRGTLRRVAERASAWRALTTTDESAALVRWRLVSATVVAFGALLLATGRHVMGTDAAVGALLAIGAVGLATSLVTHRVRLSLPSPLDLAPALGAVVVLSATVGTRAGSLDPTFAALSVLLLPVLLLTREVVGR